MYAFQDSNAVLLQVRAVTSGESEWQWDFSQCSQVVQFVFIFCDHLTRALQLLPYISAMKFREVHMDNLMYVGASQWPAQTGKNVAGDGIPITLH